MEDYTPSRTKDPRDPSHPNYRPRPDRLGASESSPPEENPSGDDNTEETSS